MKSGIRLVIKGDRSPEGRPHCEKGKKNPATLSDEIAKFSVPCGIIN